MAWRKPTLQDIAATLSQKELDDFRKHPDFESAEDPVEALLSRTAAMVRGYCRRNGSVTLSPDAGEIPDSLVSAAMDYAAFDILKRLPGATHEWRERAREQAIALFDKVADGKVVPESYDAEEDATSTVLPVFSVGLPRILG